MWYFHIWRISLKKSYVKAPLDFTPEEALSAFVWQGIHLLAPFVGYSIYKTPDEPFMMGVAFASLSGLAYASVKLNTLVKNGY